MTVIEGKGVAIQGKEDGSTDEIRIKRGRPEKFTPQEVIAALIESDGMLTDAAKILRCHYATVRRYIDLYPEVGEVFADIDEHNADLVEGKALEIAKEGDGKMIRFLLSTKYRHRGYVSEQTIKKLEGKVNLKDLSVEQLERLRDGESLIAVLTSSSTSRIGTPET